MLNSDHPDARCVDPGIAVLRWTGALPPDLRIPIIMAPIFFLGFFASALGEEIGWQGYAFGYLRSRWNALESAVILGAAWALWHVIPFLQTHRGLRWVAWQSMATIVMRIIIVWLYVNAGDSILAAALFHSMNNVSVFLFPNYGSNYDPFVACVILTLTAVSVVFLWRPRTMARFRYAPPNGN